MDLTQARGVVVRYRARFKEAYAGIAVFLISMYFWFCIDILTSPGIAVHKRTIDRIEALVLVGIMAMGPIVFLVRHYLHLRRKRKGSRSLSTEEYVGTAAFRDALHALMARPLPVEVLKGLHAVPEKK